MPKDNKNELFYHVDENDNVLGSVKREVAIGDPTIIHRAIQIVISNKDKVLLQKRSMKKDSYPGFWTVSASGHVSFGQTYEEAASRELFEEIGLKSQLSLVTKHIVRMEHETEMEAIFTGKATQEEIHFDTYEISETAWIPKDQLTNFIKNHNVTEPAKVTFKVLKLI